MHVSCRYRYAIPCVGRGSLSAPASPCAPQQTASDSLIFFFFLNVCLLSPGKANRKRAPGMHDVACKGHTSTCSLRFLVAWGFSDLTGARQLSPRLLASDGNHIHFGIRPAADLVSGHSLVWCVVLVFLFFSVLQPPPHPSLDEFAPAHLNKGLQQKCHHHDHGLVCLRDRPELHVWSFSLSVSPILIAATSPVLFLLFPSLRLLRLGFFCVISCEEQQFGQQSAHEHRAEHVCRQHSAARAVSI
jgi:hypothetical protein